MITLAHEDLVAIPPEGLAFGPFAPADHGSPGPDGVEREVLEPNDIDDDRSPECRSHCNLLRRQSDLAE
jgi:hypothetical protein